MFLAMLVALLPVHVAQACSAFIVGKDLTADGSTLFGRTEDYPYYPNGGKHNKNYVVVEAKKYKEHSGESHNKNIATNTSKQQ